MDGGGWNCLCYCEMLCGMVLMEVVKCEMDDGDDDDGTFGVNGWSLVVPLSLWCLHKNGWVPRTHILYVKTSILIKRVTTDQDFLSCTPLELHTHLLVHFYRCKILEL